jgi:NADH:ubiquinone oxidoreductase subunit K
MNAKTRKIGCTVFTVLTLLCGAATAQAAPTLSLNWYKNNGYGMGNDIGGQWTITAVTSADVSRVEFYLDNQLQQNSTQAPFKWAFNTADYSLGAHTVKAVAYAAEGQTGTVQADRNFVEYSAENVFGVVIGVFVAVIAIALVVAVYRIKKQTKNKHY